MKIEDFVSTMRQSELHVRIARTQQNDTTPGTAANLRALIDYRRERDALSMLIADHPDLVARILVRAWETGEVLTGDGGALVGRLARVEESVQDIRAHLLGGEQLV